MNTACSSADTPVTTPKLCSVVCSSGRWKATTIMQGDTTYITRLLMAVAAWSSSSLTLPSTKPTTSSRYSVTICWPTVRNDCSMRIPPKQKLNTALVYHKKPHCQAMFSTKNRRPRLLFCPYMSLFSRPTDFSV